MEKKHGFGLVLRTYFIFVLYLCKLIVQGYQIIFCSMQQCKNYLQEINISLSLCFNKVLYQKNFMIFSKIDDKVQYLVKKIVKYQNIQHSVDRIVIFLYIICQYCQRSYNIQEFKMSVCAISGKPVEKATVSKKSGHIFEKSIILKHLASFPYCPVTNQPLTPDDLIDIVPHSQNIQKSEDSSLSYLNKLIQDYDTLILQTHYMKRALNETQKELINSVYQNEAAQIVITRLLKQKQQAENEVQKLKSRLSNH